MSDNNETPNFVYNGKTLRVLFINSTLQYVSINDIATITEILPFITRCVDARYVLEANGEKWIQNDIFAELLRAFHPDIQLDIIRQTLESVLKNITESSVGTEGSTLEEIENSVQELKNDLLKLFFNNEDSNGGQ